MTWPGIYQSAKSATLHYTTLCLVVRCGADAFALENQIRIQHLPILASILADMYSCRSVSSEDLGKHELKWFTPLCRS